jgi:hypothetical protein
VLTCDQWLTTPTLSLAAAAWWPVHGSLIGSGLFCFEHAAGRKGRLALSRSVEF